MSPYARKTDSVHAAIIQALEQCGWTVQDTSRVGGGFPDAVAVRGFHFNYVHHLSTVGKNEPIVRLLEFKTGRGRLTKAQQQFHARFPVIILRSVEDAVKLR